MDECRALAFDRNKKEISILLDAKSSRLRQKCNEILDHEPSDVNLLQCMIIIQMRESTPMGDLDQAYPVINTRGAFGINMNLMTAKGQFLAFGGNLFNKTNLDENGNIINNPNLLMFDTNENSDITYSKDAIEKLRTRLSNFEYENKLVIGNDKF